MRYPRGAAPEVPARCGHLSALPLANVPTLYRSAQSSGHPKVDATLWVRISSHASASPALCARPRPLQSNLGLGTPGRFHLGEVLWHSSKELHRIRYIVYHMGESRWTCSWIRSDVFEVQVVHAATARSAFALAHSMQTRVADVSWCALRTTPPEPAIEPKTASRKKSLFSSANCHVLPRSLLYCIRVVFEIPSCPCTLNREDRSSLLRLARAQDARAEFGRATHTPSPSKASEREGLSPDRKIAPQNRATQIALCSRVSQRALSSRIFLS